MPTLTVGGRRFHLEDPHACVATGTPVVFLHGLGSCGDDWLFQVEALGPRRRILLPDLPGHGLSDGLAGWPRIGAFSQAVHAALERYRGMPAHLVGLSLGGAVALQMALDHPGQVAALVLVNSFSRFAPGAWSLARGSVRLALILAGRMDAVGAWVAGELFPRPDQDGLRRLAAGRLAACRRSDYLRALVALARFDVRSRLGEVGCPTLVVRGELDRSLPERLQREIVARVPGARLVVVPDSRHATPVDAATAFNRELACFLEKVEGRAAARAGLPWATR